MHNITALENAGFKERNQISPDFEIRSGFKTIYINPSNLEIEVYFKGVSKAISKHKATDLEDVKAFLYGHLGYYLDFTEKPKYDWGTVKAKLSKDSLELYTAAANALHRLHTYKVIDKLEAQSMIAKLKLNIIIQQIDKDYPKEEEGFWGCIHLSHRGRGNPVEMKAYETTDPKEWSMITECVQGAKILLDQNPKLLKNLFKIETDA